MTPLRVAVVGAGHLGRIHARLIGQMKDVELVGVVDPVRETGTRVAADCGTEAFASHMELIDRIDAAVVATPTRDHFPVAKDLLNHGIHCLLEKPITRSVDEADQLIATAANRNLTLQVGHVERFNPAFSAALPHIHRPKYIEATRAAEYTFRSTDVGVVLDLMIHDLDVVLSLVRSPIIDIEAIGISVFGPHEDMAQARLVFENGCIANLSASRTSFEPARRMHVYSERGYADIDFASRAARIVRPNDRLLRREIEVHALSKEEQNRIKQSLFTKWLPLMEIPPGDANPLLDELRDFVDSIQTSREPRVTGLQGRNALTGAEQILARIATHPWDGTAAGPIGPQVVPSATRLRISPWAPTIAKPGEGRRRAG